MTEREGTTSARPPTSQLLDRCSCSLVAPAASHTTCSMSGHTLQRRLSSNQAATFPSPATRIPVTAPVQTLAVSPQVLLCCCVHAVLCVSISQALGDDADEVPHAGAADWITDIASICAQERYLVGCSLYQECKVRRQRHASHARGAKPNRKKE